VTQPVKNKVVIITGASSGFGEAMAERFAREGARLIIMGRNKGRLESVEGLLKDLGADTVSVIGDINNPKTYEKSLAIAMEKWNGVDILINNAGGGVKVAPIDEQTRESIRASISLNLESVINGCRIMVPQMKKQKNGLIINVTSLADRRAWPHFSIYSAAKAGLSMFSRCLYTELRPFNIRVTVIVPGASKTRFSENAGLEPLQWDESDALRPEHIAHAALFAATLPAGAVAPEISVSGTNWEVIPL
jgi:NADP-dependent 3-hydroxy acid dehydrogenase YdfG